MENTKVFQLILSLEHTTREQIIPYLKNYAGGEDTLPFRLYKIINDHLGEGVNSLNREYVWKSLYPNKNYKDLTLRKASADLMRHLESALSTLHLQKSPLDRRLHYLNYLREQETDHDLINKEITKSIKLFNNSENPSGPGYYERFRLEELNYENSYRSGSAWKKTNINRIDQNLNAFFILEKLRLALSIFSRQKYIRFEKELPFLEVIFKLVESGKMDDFSLIRLYYYAVLTYQVTDSDKMYFKLKEGLFKTKPVKGSPYIRELTTIALSYCIGKINQNQSPFYREALNWYQMMIKEDMLIEQEHLAATTYRNIVLIAIRLQEFEWATSFAQGYSSYLKSDIRQSTMMLTLGQISFHKKDYEQVLQHLMNVNYISLSYNLQSKLILAATYYELKEYDLLSSFLTSFNTYLRRKRKDMSKEKYIRHKKFIHLLSQITKTADWDQDKWMEIREQLESDHNIVSYSWLREKIGQRI